ncbi:16S rRNA (guanine(527)-N(7))-methyltransferase RsmG [Desulfonatronovibrio magnus]|uniref:16S rRNA (guanine(527)-N(7))-methyltransferase RsmG n=1 Tax=Desulfonatronovibrio magnus TaxID=698827 RepID=UPI000697CEA5|nr:16S rRNA (guanine(527)-N(7))-methyltransferase RsmG [Desulfonatronovibrio magnus]
MNQNVLADVVQHYGFNLNQNQIQSLFSYLDLLMQWNKVMNLVGPYEWGRVLEELVLDSFFLWKFIDENYQIAEDDRVLDLGAGAGLPGIPLRIVWNSGRYYLVESRTRRAAFMNRALASVRLNNTLVLNCRFQQIEKSILPARLIISRAFMPWSELLPQTKEMLAKKGGIIILSSDKYRGQKLDDFGLKCEHVYKVKGKKRYLWGLEL